MPPAVEDVDMEDFASEFKGRRYDLVCPDCGASMRLKRSTKIPRPFYGCVRWPDCKSTHGARADGTPLGVPGDKATREARKRAHDLFDQLWQKGLLHGRENAYEWMQKALGLSAELAHIAKLNGAQCDRLHRLILQKWPQLKTVWDRLLNEPLLEDLPWDVPDDDLY